MGQKMVDYLISLGVRKKDIIFSPRGLNTAGEIATFIKIAPLQDTLWVVSSWYHLPRILWLFWVRGRLVWPACAWCHSWADLRVEPLKLLKDIVTLGGDIKGLPAR
jgi:hypothetical protein